MNNTRSHFVLLVLALLIVTTSVYPVSRGKYAGEFMAIGVGGRALGLGGAYAGIASDVTAGYWNPAGLSHLMYPQITLMHDERFGGLVNYDYGAVATPFGHEASLGFSVIRLGVDNIPDTRNAGVDINGNPLPPDQWQNADHTDPSRVTYYNSADWAFLVTYAKQMTGDLSLGVNLKIIRRDMEVGSATGIGFDIGAQYRPTDRILLGANFQDVTTTLIAWSTGTNELISPTLKAGAGYIIDMFGGRLIPAFDTDIRFENRRTAANAYIGPVSFDFHGGLEYDFRNLVAVRAGYSDIGSLNFGTGIHLPRFDIDYTFARFNGDDQLGNTHRISLTFTLQSEQFIRSAE